MPAVDFVITNAFSKWVDIWEMRDITASSTIKVCKEYFGTWGLAETVVSDNGPAFIAESFERFLKSNNIQQILTAHYYPALNGAAENAVRTFKRKFKILVEQMSRKDALMLYLVWYRNTPHCTAGRPPAELQLGFKSKTRFDMLTVVRAIVWNVRNIDSFSILEVIMAIVFHENDNDAMRDCSSHSEKCSEAEVVR